MLTWADWFYLLTDWYLKCIHYTSKICLELFLLLYTNQSRSFGDYRTASVLYLLSRFDGNGFAFDNLWRCYDKLVVFRNTQTFLAGYHIIYQGSPHAPHHMQNGFSQNISHAQPQPLSPNDSPGFSYTESNSSGSRENLGHEQANGSPVLHNSVSMGPTLPVGKNTCH